MQDVTDFAEAERAGWADPGRVAAYAALFGVATDQVRPAIVAATGAGPGRRVLDLCCGHGNVAEALVAAGAEVTGLDFSPAFLEVARARVPGAAFVEGDAQALPFADGAFDAVACNLGIGHVPDPAAAVAEIARVLGPGGVAALSAWVEPEASPGFRILLDALREQGADLSAAPPGPDFHLIAREAKARALLEGAGLADVRFARIDVAFRFDRAEAFAEVLRRATVRAAMVVEAQPPGVQAAVWRRVTATVAGRFGDGAGGYRVPYPAMLATARRG